MELAQKTESTATEVQPHNEHKATKESPQHSADIKQRPQQQNSENKSATPQSLDESAEDINWPRLVVSSDEEEKKKDADKQEQFTQEFDNTNSDISSEEITEEIPDFVAKRKRYEVSRLGSEEILLGCDEIDGEARLVNESKEPDLSDNMADDTETTKLSSENNLSEQEILDETEAPVAKRLKKSPEKFSPRREETKRQSSKQEQAHIVGDAEETRVQNNSITKTRSAGNAKQSISPSKPLSAQDDFYKKPFEYGWKRELVWRATPESGRERADVYFISPAGKKIRTRHDIPPLLHGELTMDHFCWLREPVGMGPEFETVRNAKPNPNRASTYALATTSTPNAVTGKRMPKPKTPKGASPPPEGWTPTKALKVNNAALNSKSGGFGLGFGGITQNSRATGNAATRSSSNKKKYVLTIIYI